MKKLLSVMAIMMVCCCSAILFAGCSSENGKIEFTAVPTAAIAMTQDVIDDQMKYIDKVDEELGKITFKLTVKDDSGNDVVTFEGSALEARNQKGATISGFSLKTAGKRTAKITMEGVSAEFSYEVTVA